MRTLFILVSILTGTTVLGLAWRDAKAAAEPGATLTGSARGEFLFQANCAICHGKEGRGDGPAAGVLDPRPRNFRLGKYRLGTAQGPFPSENDILETMRNGIPGTGMPAWRHIPADDLKLIADFCMEVCKQGMKESLLADGKVENAAEAEEVVHDLMEPEPPIEYPAEPRADAESVARGSELFSKNCANCHNQDGHGRQDPSWKTAEGYPLASRDLRRGVFKGGRSGRAIFTRIYRGIPGTPMPGGKQMTGDQMWDVVHYVQSIINSDQPQMAGR